MKNPMWQCVEIMYLLTYKLMEHTLFSKYVPCYLAEMNSMDPADVEVNT
jgi:hypothetical protein